MIICPICNKQFKQITNTHLKKHNLTLEIFKEQFPEVNLLSDELKLVLKENSLKADNSQYNKSKVDKNIKKYLENPSFCSYCSEQLSYEKRNNSFCNNSCSASFHNNKKTSIRKKRIAQYLDNPNKCKTCNSILAYDKKSQIYCSSKCVNLKPSPTPKVVGEFSTLYNCTCKHCNLKMLLPSPKQYCEECKENHSNLRMRYKFNFNVYHYPDLFDLDLLNEKGWYAPRGKSGKWNPNGLSRDHKVSVAEAIKNNYDSYYITHPMNCELMPHSENQKKHSDCSLSYSSLKQLVDEYDRKQ